MQKALDEDIVEVPLSEVLDRARRGEVAIWRARNGEAHGVLVTEMIDYFGHLQLLVWLFGGDKLHTCGGKIWQSIQTVAQVNKAEHIRAICTPRLAHALGRYGFELRAMEVVREVEELSDG